MSECIMDRESLKRHCEAMCHKFKYAPTSGTYGEHRLVLDLLEQTTWIPVKKKLPKDGEEVLFCDIDNDIMISHHVEGEQITHFCEKGTFENIKNVRAWMPLPNSFKGW